MKLIHCVRAAVFFVAGFIAQLVFIITGLFVCLLPKIKDYEGKKAFTNAIGVWYPVHLPKYAWLWDNEEDGAMGDHRGWYWTEYSIPNEPVWFKHYFWLAIRNPANNFKRFVLGFDVRTKTIETIYGQDYVRDDFKSTGFQLVRAGWRYHFYLVYRYGGSSKALVIELGNKFQVRHNGVEYDDEYDYFKGFTFEINPIKDIS